ncbi:MAG: hypothetical protein M3463_03110 [Verrucomicrobiota bacterium]|nr:hypothetical protein [Verrucomicrobiota bacterium]
MTGGQQRAYRYGTAPLLLGLYLGGYIVYRFSGDANFYDAGENVSAAAIPGLRINVTTPNERFFASFFGPCIAAENFYHRYLYHQHR